MRHPIRSRAPSRHDHYIRSGIAILLDASKKYQPDTRNRPEYPATLTVNVLSASHLATRHYLDDCCDQPGVISKGKMGDSEHGDLDGASSTARRFVADFRFESIRNANFVLLQIIAHRHPQNSDGSRHEEQPVQAVDQTHKRKPGRLQQLKNKDFRPSQTASPARACPSGEAKATKPRIRYLHKLKSRATTKVSRSTFLNSDASFGENHSHLTFFTTNSHPTFFENISSYNDNGLTDELPLPWDDVPRTTTASDCRLLHPVQA